MSYLPLRCLQPGSWRACSGFAGAPLELYRLTAYAMERIRPLFGRFSVALGRYNGNRYRNGLFSSVIDDEAIRGLARRLNRLIFGTYCGHIPFPSMGNDYWIVSRRVCGGINPQWRQWPKGVCGCIGRIHRFHCWLGSQTGCRFFDVILCRQGDILVCRSNCPVWLIIYLAVRRYR